MRIAVASWLVLLAACGYRERAQVLTAADLQVPERTRIANYMSAPLRPGSPSEQPPAQVSRASLLDEATIVKLDADEICFAVVVRSALDLDTAVSEMRLLVDGKPARVADEEVAVRDHAFSGERDVLVASFVSKSAFGGLRLTEPAEQTCRVHERRARVCRTGDHRETRELALEVIVVKDDDRGNWGTKFVWQVE